MDGIIQMLPPSLRRWSTYMDFAGQKNAERIFQVILVVHGVIGFIAGYVMQQLSVAIYIVLFGFALSSLIILPPWPVFRGHPLNWQPVGQATAATSSTTASIPSTPASLEKKKKR